MSTSKRQTTLFEAVMWGTSKQVQEILNQRGLIIDNNWTDYALLITALKRKRKEIAKILIGKGCRVQKVPRNPNTDTPLHYAIKMEDIDLVKVLLTKNISVDDVDESGEIPLGLAIKKKNLTIVDLILSNVNVNTANKDGLSHFHISCMRNNTEIVKKFINQGVDVNDTVNVNAKEWSGYTPLHFAVNYECLDTIQLLLSCNADVTLKNSENMTPLHLAVQKKNNNIINLFLNSQNMFNSNPSDNNGFSHFLVACMKNHVIAVNNFLQNNVNITQAVNPNSPVCPGFSPLHFAVKGTSEFTNQVALLELLLQHGADVNAKDAQGRTPLHLACLQNSEKIPKLIEDAICSSKSDAEVNEFLYTKLCDIISQTEQVKVIELLIKHKSDVNAKDLFKETALFYLYKNHHFYLYKKDSDVSHKMKYDDRVLEKINQINLKRKEILKLLLDHGANVNDTNNVGQTLLHLIAGTEKCFNDSQKEEITELILSKGANVDAKTQFGTTPLHLAAKQGHCKLIEVLLKHNANVNSSEGSDNSTPLHLATSYQQVKTIKLLLKHKADVSATKGNGMNVLHIMALINPEACRECEFIEMYDNLITTFIEQGCNIDAQDINGRTPLHLASWDHNNAGTWALMRHFANVNIEDFGGETPLAFPLNGTERCSNIYSMFKDYVNMLKVTGLHISEKTNLYYDSLYNNDPLDANDDLLLQCKEEIERMKNMKINNNCSLYDIIFKNSYEMEFYARHELFNNILRTEDFHRNFNIYGNLLKSQYRKGLFRENLLKVAKESLEFMTDITLPNSCCEKIFQYLTDDKLNDLIKAKSVKISKKKISYNHKEYDSLEKAIAYCKKLYSEQMDTS